MFIGIPKLSPAENQYSLQHIRLFAVHNQIFDDPWTPGLVFFVDEKSRVCSASFDAEVSLDSWL